MNRSVTQGPPNQDIARRFLKGTLEGLAIYHQNRTEALRVMTKYHGITDPKVASTIYEEGLKMERKRCPGSNQPS